MNLQPARLLSGLLLVFALALAACGPAVTGGSNAPAEAGPTAETASSGEAEAPTAVAPTATPANEIPEDVPVVDGALELKVTRGGATIAYQAPDTTVEKMTEFYTTELAARGWEQVNKRDSGFGDSITLLRKKPEKNISVTLQSIAGSPNVRVLITLINK